MYLTREQERMLNGEYGWIYAKALEIIVKVGEILGAEKLIEIKHAHVSGISYSNIGEPGLEFIRDFYMSGARARVYTTINPGCIDVSFTSRIIDDRFKDKQLMINNYLEGLGFKPTYTCIPYIHRPPVIDEHLAWGESSAVIYANSILGARTNREGGPLALASALTGYTYYYGLHIPGNRRVKSIIDIKGIEPDLYGGVGLWIGENIKNIPMIINATRDISNLKILLASAAASGDHGLIVVDGVTPVKTFMIDDRVEKITVDVKDIEEYVVLRDDIEGSILGYIGCPHLDPFEFEALYKMIVERGVLKNGNKLMISIPAIYSRIYGFEIEHLRRLGVEVLIGTCPIVSILSERYDYVLTNSGKACFYLKRQHGFQVYIASLKYIIDKVYGDK